MRLDTGSARRDIMLGTLCDIIFRLLWFTSGPVTFTPTDHHPQNLNFAEILRDFNCPVLDCDVGWVE